jgi:hypothetical protein
MPEALNVDIGLSSVPREFPWEFSHTCNKTSHTVLEERVFVS